MTNRKNDWISIILFLLPALILFIGILVAPLIASGYFSFFEWKGFGDKTYIGLQNYKDLFDGTEVPFLLSAKNALLLALFSLIIQLPLSLGLALLLGKGVKGERFFLSVNFLPVLISSVVIATLWKKIYYPAGGLLNSVLRALGILKKDQADILWLAESAINPQTGKRYSYILGAVFVPMIWQYVGYHMLLMYAGVKSVPPELREAAKIDGATDGQINRHIVLPSMKQIIKVCVIFSVTGSFKAYDLIAIMVGYKSRRAAVPSILLLDQTINWGKYGRGSAVAVLLIIMCFLAAIIISEVFKDREKV